MNKRVIEKKLEGIGHCLHRIKSKMPFGVQAQMDVFKEFADQVVKYCDL